MLFPSAGAGRPTDRLFRNDLAPGRDGRPRLAFTDVTAQAGIPAGGYGLGAATGDYDNDGDVDLYVANLGPNRLLRNSGDGHFTDVTAASGAGDDRWSNGAAFVDVDRDGWLDLWVVNYVVDDPDRHCFSANSRRDYCGPADFTPVTDRLLHNRGDGTFEDVSVHAGITGAAAPGLGIVTFDADGDGWVDVYVANDGTPNQLWLNRHDGTFRDDGVLAGVALSAAGRSQAGMGVDAGDVDNDGDDDIIEVHLDGETNALYLNQGGGLFAERSAAAGLAAPGLPYTSFGAGWIDVDNDGWLDLFVASGAVKILERPSAPGRPVPAGPGQPALPQSRTGRPGRRGTVRRVARRRGGPDARRGQPRRRLRGRGQRRRHRRGDHQQQRTAAAAPQRRGRRRAVGRPAAGRPARARRPGGTGRGRPQRRGDPVAARAHRRQLRRRLRPAGAGGSRRSRGGDRGAGDLARRPPRALERPGDRRLRHAGRGDGAAARPRLAGGAGTVTRRAWRLALALGLPALAALLHPPAAAATPPAAEPAAPSSEALLPVPKPNLEGFDPAVVQQLEEVADELGAALAAAGGREAAAAAPEALRRQLADAYGQTGMAAQAYALAAAAEPAYRNAQRLAPDDVRWPHLLGRLLEQAGRLDEAEAAYRRALELAPGDVPALVYLAGVLRTDGEADAAADLLHRALELAPGSAAAHAGLGEIALAASRWPEAIDHLQKALAAAPGANRLHYSLGLAYRGLGDLARARSELEQRGEVGVRPADPLWDDVEAVRGGGRVHRLAGRRALRVGRYADAANELRAALAADPESVGIRVDLAYALSHAGARDEALALLEEAYGKAPDDPGVLFNLGSLLAATGRAEAAVPLLRRLVEADPSDTDSRLELADALAATGALPEALDEYRRAMATGTGGERAILGEAQTLVRMARYGEALARLEAAWAAAPTSGQLTHALARLLAASPDPTLRDGPRAVELAQRVVKASPTVGHAATYAMALAESGRCDEAARLQEEAIDAAREEGTPELVASLQPALERYRGTRPCRPPADPP